MKTAQLESGMDEHMDPDPLTHLDSVLLREVFRALETSPEHATREDLASQRLTILACLRMALERERDLREHLREAGRTNRRLRQLSSVDPLTEIANRRFFDRHLEKEWKRCGRHKSPLSLLVLDIDHFKHFNDSCGHPAGDHCLRQVARALSQVLNRPGDHVARVGGEEFAILLPDTDSEGAKTVARKVLEKIRSQQISHPSSSVAAYVTASIGVATLVPDVKEKAHSLFVLADEALYKAKAEGRDRFSCSAKPLTRATPLAVHTFTNPTKTEAPMSTLYSLLFRRASA